MRAVLIDGNLRRRFQCTLLLDCRSAILIATNRRRNGFSLEAAPGGHTDIAARGEVSFTSDARARFVHHPVVSHSTRHAVTACGCSIGDMCPEFSKTIK